MEDFFVVNFNNYVLHLIKSILIQVGVPFALNFIFARLAYKSSPCVFNLLACLSGSCQLFFAASKNLIVFTYITIILYSLLFQTAVKLNQFFHYTRQNVLKLYIIIYGSYCFSIYKVDDNLEEFVIMLITLSMKLLCAAKNADAEQTDSLPNLGSLIGYLTYTPWISFTSFVTLRRKRHKKTREWFFRICVAIPHAIIFKLLSDNIVTIDSIFEIPYITPVALSIIKAFQYRNKYYFRGQIAEIEILAAGVRQHNWSKHLIFDFRSVEFSVMMQNGLKGFNLPLSEFFYDSFIVKDKNERKVSALVHIGLLLLIVFWNSPRYAALFMLVLGSLFYQEHAIAALQRITDVCIYSCPSPFCYHLFGRRYIGFCYLKFLFILKNQYRMSMLFVNFETVFSSVTCLIHLIFIDIGIICCFRERFKKQFHYFKHSNHQI